MNYKLLGHTGLKVSELCLGTMGFGTTNGWGTDVSHAFQILDAFGNAGGNFLDTANFYQKGETETILGQYLKESKDRDYWVVATKYSLYDNLHNPNASGNNRKNLIRSVDASLKRLQTDYIDVLYLHIWDWLTPADEVLSALQHVIANGKVNYIAISDTPAWVVAQSQTIAELRGWNKFAALQIEYSLLQRTPERELIPMAKQFGLTVTPWAPLAGGALTGKYLLGEKGRIKPQSARLNDYAQKVTKEVMTIAQELGVKPSHVALQWTRQQGFKCIPIVGATKLSQLEENLGMLKLELNQEHLNRLEAVSAINLGFPGEFYKEEAVRLNNFGGFYHKIDR